MPEARLLARMAATCIRVTLASETELAQTFQLWEHGNQARQTIREQAWESAALHFDLDPYSSDGEGYRAAYDTRLSIEEDRLRDKYGFPTVTLD